MSKAHPPEVKIHGHESLKVNGGRHVQGVLQRVDPFLDLVVAECGDGS